jgi:predicted Zn-dependent peptidase
MTCTDFHGAIRRATLLLALTLSIPAATVAAQDRVTILTEPGTPVIATEVLIATGPADEQEGEAGLAYLSARTVTEPVRERLAELGAHLNIEAYKDALSFSLIAAPDAWEEATHTLMVALFRDPADSLATEREQRAIRATLIGREASPADAVAREMDAAFFGPDHPWRRSAVGYASTIQDLEVTDVQRFLHRHFIPERTVVAVVGPIDDARAREHLRPYVGSADLTLSRVPPPQPVESPVQRDYDSITTWIAASYRLPPDADVEALRLLAHLAVESLSFGPSQRSIYDVQGKVLPRLGGGELRLQVVVPPHEAEEWAERMLGEVSRIAHGMASEEVLRDRLRRYRGIRLLELDAPEERAREAARRLLIAAGEPNALSDPGELSVERLRSAAQSLSAPTVVFLGPFLTDTED